MRYHFGPFTLDARRRRLYRGEDVVALAPKGVDTLLVLIEQAGAIVEKDELIERLWPDTAVTEANLTQHVFTLRKALGERGGESQFIATVPRRGYRFVADVRVEDAPQAPPVSAPGTLARFVIPLPQDLPAARLTVPVMALAPNGRVLLYVARSGSSTALCRRALDGLEVRPIEGTDGATTPFWSPDGEWIGFAAHGRLWMVRATGGTPHPIADAPECRGAVWTAAGALVFAPGPADGLWLLSPDGAAPRPLTNVDFAAGERTHRWPAVLPDGRIVFTIGSAGIASFDEAAVGSVAADGGAVRPIAARASDPRALADGRVAFVRDARVWIARPDDPAAPSLLLDDVAIESTGIGHFALGDRRLVIYMRGGRQPTRRELAWVDADGNRRRLDVPADEIEEPRISPDGAFVAYGRRDRTSDLWIHDVRRGTRARVTTEGDNFGALWTPDGEWLTFSSNRDGRAGLYLARTDGSGAGELFVASDVDLVPGAWSPDGRRLLYTQYHPETGAGIWMVDREERAPRPVLVTRANEYAPVWSPDGRWFAFTSDESGVPQVYIRRFPSGTRVQVSIQDGSEVVWPRGGDRLFFRSGNNLVASRVVVGETFDVSPPEMVLADAGDPGSPLGLPNYDVAAGGREILQVRSLPRVTSAPQLIVLVSAA